MRLRFILTLFILFVHEGNAADICPPVKKIDSRDIVGLEKYIKETDFKSLECFIASLPQDIRAFRTYFKKSLSLQEASTNNPRAMVGSPDGGFVLTFNGHQLQKGFNELEFLALDNNTNPTRWIPGVFKMNNGKVQIQKDIAKCTACHGSPIRPIWGIYPSWPNSFGSIDDWLPDEKDIKKDSKFIDQDMQAQTDGSYPRLTQEKINSSIAESHSFRKFRQKAQSHPRYSSLESASDPSNPVYPYTETYRNRNNAFRPNLVIGSVLTKRQDEILSKRVLKNPFFINFSASIFHYINCRTTDTDHAQNKKIFDLLKSIYSSRFEKNLSIDNYYIQNIYSDDYVDLIGLLPHEKTLLFANDTYFLNDQESSYFSGYFGIEQTVMSKLLEKHILNYWPDKNLFLYPPYSLDFKYEDLTNYPSSYFKSAFLGKDFDQFLTNDFGNLIGSRNPMASEERKAVFVKMCEKLHAEAQKELNTSQGKSFRAEQKPLFNKPYPEALTSCIQCHEHPDKITTPIPFSSKERLAQFSKKYSSSLGYGDLLDAVNVYVNSNELPAHLNGTRMPLGRAPLTLEEINAINVWIKAAIN